MLYLAGQTCSCCGRKCFTLTGRNQPCWQSRWFSRAEPPNRLGSLLDEAIRVAWRYRVEVDADYWWKWMWE